MKFFPAILLCLVFTVPAMAEHRRRAPLRRAAQVVGRVAAAPFRLAARAAQNARERQQLRANHRVERFEFNQHCGQPAAFLFGERPHVQRLASDRYGSEQLRLLRLDADNCRVERSRTSAYVSASDLDRCRAFFTGGY